jgi:hypothetical protein
MRSTVALALLGLVLLGCADSSPLAPDHGGSLQEEGSGPRVVVRLRPGRFLCGLPADENGNTCVFVPDEPAGP